MRKHFRENPLSVRKARLLCSWGVTLEEYISMLKNQKRRCAICGTTKMDNGRRNFCVDHNHKTGKVRGLLCGKCNKGLGLFKDSISILEKAISYLKIK